MNAYSIDGSAASLAPFSQRTLKVLLDTDHNGAPIYSGTVGAILTFGEASVTHHRQWLATVDGGSHTFDILDEVALGYVTLSPCYTTVEEWPEIQSTISMGFTMTVRKKS
jgi:hypothetical protein